LEIKDFFSEHEWKLVKTLRMPEKKPKYFSCEELSLSNSSMKLLNTYFPQGIYNHQRLAIERFTKGLNVCMTTGTASGKSLPFYICAIEKLEKDPTTKILAVYPLKALGKEQEERWKASLRVAGLNAVVGRIDGQIPVSERPNILKNSQILIVTPDVIHAWLMSNLGNSSVHKFLGRLRLLIVDEIHNYTGVFGSNSAFLFRRLQHILDKLGSPIQYICASATIANPDTHLQGLLGVKFEVIGSDKDTSPKQEVSVVFLNPPQSKDLLTNISDLLIAVAKNKNYNFIVFVDSRKQTEYIASIVSRQQQKEIESTGFSYDHLRSYNILPFRAGYEESDRNVIQERLSEGKLSGVISTSALELGIDIPYLNLGILVGVPHSATSFFQRIGRIGRKAKGEIFILNSGDILSESIFSAPESILNMPLSEGALYLENPRIQYIHALCLARQGGENQQLTDLLSLDEERFETKINWPQGFEEACKSEIIGVIPAELRNLKEQAGEDPNHVFPLRDIDVQFKVEFKRGPDKRRLGSLTYGQVMREAYPGAVYYYTSRPFRVYRIIMHSRQIAVRPERKYTTVPQKLPTLVFPDLSLENIYNSYKHGSLLIHESDLQIRETITGFKERRGPNQQIYRYPLDGSVGIYFDLPRFTRNYFTSGVIFTHPVLNDSSINQSIIAEILFESFLMVLPFERNDISFACDKHRMKSINIAEGDRFICIYDQTYGSLRLSGRLLEKEILQQTLNKAAHLATQYEKSSISQESIEALELLKSELSHAAQDMKNDSQSKSSSESSKKIKVIMPGSKGLNIDRDNEEFFIDGIFYSPGFNALAYRGKHLSEKKSRNADVIISVPEESIQEIPGESRLGFYNLDTGEIKEA